MRQSTVLRIAGQIQRIGPAAAHARQLKRELPQDAMDLPHGVSRCVPSGLPMVLQGAGKRVIGTVFPLAAT